MLIEDVSAYLAVKRVDGALRQVWSYWDGLLQVENLSESGYALVLYTPDMVAGVDAAGLYALVEGAAWFKRFDVAWNEDAGKLSITESAPERQSVVTAWQQDADGAWTLSRGEGEEMVCSTQSRTVLEPASAVTGALEVWQLVTTVRRGEAVASSTCEVFQDTPLGQLLLSRVEGYGSPGARTTLFEYDGSGNEIRRTAPDGSVVENCYDATGRLVKSYEPWRGGDYTLIIAQRRRGVNGKNL